jgi:hypothetical protein
MIRANCECGEPRVTSCPSTSSQRPNLAQGLS